MNCPTNDHARLCPDLFADRTGQKNYPLPNQMVQFPIHQDNIFQISQVESQMKVCKAAAGCIVDLWEVYFYPEQAQLSQNWAQMSLWMWEKNINIRWSTVTIATILVNMGVIWLKGQCDFFRQPKYHYRFKRACLSISLSTNSVIGMFDVAINGNGISKSVAFFDLISTC